MESIRCTDEQFSKETGKSQWSPENINEQLVKPTTNDVSKSVREIHSLLNSKSAIGLEHISEHRATEVTYYCNICNITASPISMQQHVSSDEHRKKYLSENVSPSTHESSSQLFAKEYEKKYGGTLEQIKVSAECAGQEKCENPQNSYSVDGVRNLISFGHCPEHLCDVDFVINDSQTDQFQNYNSPNFHIEETREKQNCEVAVSKETEDTGWSPEKLWEYLGKQRKNCISGSLQKLLSLSSEPTIGLEHISEHVGEDIGLTYHCNLCNITANPMCMYHHIICTKHRKKYFRQKGLLTPTENKSKLAKINATEYERRFGRLIEQIKVFKVSAEVLSQQNIWNLQNLNSIDNVRNLETNDLYGQPNVDSASNYSQPGSNQQFHFLNIHSKSSNDEPNNEDVDKQNENSEMQNEDIEIQSKDTEEQFTEETEESQWSTDRIYLHLMKLQSNSLCGSLQEVIEVSSEPTIGLEYISEHLRKDNIGSTYHCNICNFTADPCAMYQHIVSFNHRWNYFALAFPGEELSECDVKMLSEEYERKYGRFSDRIKIYEKSTQEVFPRKFDFSQWFGKQKKKVMVNDNNSRAKNLQSVITTPPQPPVVIICLSDSEDELME